MWFDSRSGSKHRWPMHLNNGNKLQQFPWNVLQKEMNFVFLPSPFSAGCCSTQMLQLCLDRFSPSLSLFLSRTLVFFSHSASLTSSKARVSGRPPDFLLPLCRAALVTIDWHWHWTGHESLPVQCVCVWGGHVIVGLCCRHVCVADLFIVPL